MRPTVKFYTFYFAIFFIISQKTWSQSQFRSFYIVGSLSKTPLSDVLVQSEDHHYSAISDEYGRVELKEFPPGIARVQLSRIGFESVIVDLATPEFKNDRPVVYLNSKIASLEEVRIKAGAGGGIFKSISDLDIHIRPINNSQEVLRIVPGLFIGQHAGGGKAEQIFLRGFDLDHGTDINITADGIPVNMVSHAHGQGYADLHFVIPELIDRVNFNKGPYYAEKGDFTTAGYVEFRTKDYLDHSFIKTEAGQFNSFRSIAGINLLKPANGIKNNSFYFAGEASYTNGYFDDPQHFSRLNGILKYHGLIDKHNNITALISGLSSKWSASGQIPDRAVESGLVDFYGAIDNTEGGHTSRINSSVELLSNLEKGGHIRTQFYYTNYNFELYSNFTFFKEDSLNGDQIRQKEQRNLFGYNGSYRKNIHLGNIKSEIITGIQARFDDINNIELTRTKNRIINILPLKFGDILEYNIGAYISSKLTLNDKLDITTGLRLDHFNNKYTDKLTVSSLSANQSVLCPKLDINFNASEKLQLYWYTGRGFHSNDTRVVVQQNKKEVLPAAWGTDIGGIFKFGKKLFIQSAFWYLWLGQEFVYVGDEGVVEAGGKTRRFGMDLSARFECFKNIFADADLSFANPRAVGVFKNESYLPLAPRFSSVGGLTYRKQTGINGSLRYRLMGDRPANEDNSVIAKGYFVTDAAINYTKKKWETGLSIQNLFNIKWKETQFDTESRLQNEQTSISEIHFTAGTPFFLRASLTFFF